MDKYLHAAYWTGDVLTGTLKVSLVGLMGIASFTVATDANRAFFLSVIGFAVIGLYRCFRRFKKDPIRGRSTLETLLDFADRNIVELIIGAAILPNLTSSIMQLIP
jgi:hypothetical protein